LGDHVTQTVDERAAVGDEDQAHQTCLLPSPGTVAPGLPIGHDAPPEVVKKKARRHQEVRRT
jgi:hypothetical protein